MLRFECGGCRAALCCDEEQAEQLVSCTRCGVPLVAPVADSADVTRLPIAHEAPLWQRGGRTVIDEEMDMTPMVDVTFLLLIFFMITASYALQKSFEAPRSEAQQSSARPPTIRQLEDDPQVIVVRVDQFNTFFVSSAAIDANVELEFTDRQSLLVELRRIQDSAADGNPPNRMVVVAHGDARHEKVVLAMDVGNEVGIPDVVLVSTEDAM